MINYFAFCAVSNWHIFLFFKMMGLYFNVYHYIETYYKYIEIAKKFLRKEISL